MTSVRNLLLVLAALVKLGASLESPQAPTALLPAETELAARIPHCVQKAEEKPLDRNGQAAFEASRWQNTQRSAGLIYLVKRESNTSTASSNSTTITTSTTTSTSTHTTTSTTSSSTDTSKSTTSSTTSTTLITTSTTKANTSSSTSESAAALTTSSEESSPTTDSEPSESSDSGAAITTNGNVAEPTTYYTTLPDGQRSTITSYKVVGAPTSYQAPTGPAGAEPSQTVGLQNGAELARHVPGSIMAAVGGLAVLLAL